ncbi:MAG: ankyrin repeat domain-containing protein [Altibacter sp.]|uniref:ankyrin repeat domain-containing protein n=1 Tax=Altibacter sp. TaxID=2024823 RepID=UPI001DBB2FD7|nr:ankyrin repeat domain-containing protein [Altibacter sp.]MBZ0326576.1 ankyrin repeat domain-containing protein [Altibacter sp.]
MKILANFLLVALIATSSNITAQNTQQKSENNVQEIIKFINNKDSLSLKKVINEHNVNSFDTTGVNMLTLGVLTGDLNIVKIIGDKGANPNLKNKTQMGSTPLMMASNSKSLEIAKYLIKKGADINIQDNNGDPVINWSAYYGNVPFTKLMLENGAKTNLKSIHSDGVMGVALKEWKDDVVNLLLEHNVSVHKVDENSLDLINAVKNNDFSLFKSLLNKDNINTRDGASNTLLMTAAKNGYFEMVTYLIAEGADINAINSVGQTALNLSVFYGKNSIAEFLIQNEADVNKTDNRFILTPLTAAIRSNNMALGEILLQKGAKINTTDGINNFSPIMWATLYQNKDFVSLLLQYNPDLSIISKYNQNVFEMTTDKEILKILKDE